MAYWKVSLVLALAICGLIHARPHSANQMLARRHWQSAPYEESAQEDSDRDEYNQQTIEKSDFVQQLAQQAEYLQNMMQEAALVEAEEEQAENEQAMEERSANGFGYQFDESPFEVDEQEEVVRELHEALPHAAPADSESDDQLEKEAFEPQDDDAGNFEHAAAEFVQDAVAKAIAEQAQLSFFEEAERGY